MATSSKHNAFVEQLVNGVHNFSAHTFKVALSNGTPSAAHTTLSAITELSTANGYTAGGLATTIGVSETSGTVTVTATDPAAWTASGAGITFRYAALYNDTSASDNLVAYWDNGSSTTVTSGNTLQIDFQASLFTLV